MDDDNEGPSNFRLLHRNDDDIRIYLCSIWSHYTFIRPHTFISLKTQEDDDRKAKPITTNSNFGFQAGQRQR